MVSSDEVGPTSASCGPVDHAARWPLVSEVRYLIRSSSPTLSPSTLSPCYILDHSVCGAFSPAFLRFCLVHVSFLPLIVVGIEVVCLLLLLHTHLRARFKCDRQTRAASILKFEFCFVLCREDEDAGHVTTSRRSSPTTQSPSSLTPPWLSLAISVVGFGCVERWSIFSHDRTIDLLVCRYCLSVCSCFASICDGG